MEQPLSDSLVARDWAIIRALADGALTLSALATAAQLPRALVGVTAKRLLDLDHLRRPREAGADAGRRLYALSARGEQALQGMSSAPESTRARPPCPG